MGHTRWTAKTVRRLTSLGISPQIIEAIEAQKEALCTHKPRPKGVRFSPRLGTALFDLGVDAQTTLEIQDYLDELRCNYLDIASPEEELKIASKEAERKAAKRAENPEAYRAYQRNLMRDRRAAAKAKKDQLSAAGKKAAAARWGKVQED